MGNFGIKINGRFIDFKKLKMLFIATFTFAITLSIAFDAWFMCIVGSWANAKDRKANESSSEGEESESD